MAHCPSKPLHKDLRVLEPVFVPTMVLEGYPS